MLSVQTQIDADSKGKVALDDLHHALGQPLYEVSVAEIPFHVFRLIAHYVSFFLQCFDTVG